MLIFWAAKASRQGVRLYSITAAGVNTRSRVIDTLDPSKFLEKAQPPIYLWTSKETNPTVRIRHDDSSRRATSALLGHYATKDNSSSRGFPSHALGYLYFRPAQPHQPAASAGLRFRLADSLEQFSTGEDLKLPNGEPWHRPLFTLVSYKHNRPLYNKLVEEGLISEDVDRCVMNLLSSEGFSRFLAGYRWGLNPLYKLSDPFTLDLSTTKFSFLALTDTGFSQAGWYNPFGDTRHQPCPRPYRGTVRLCFEPSTLPQHAGTRTVVIRVLDVVHPIECVDPNYDGWIRKPQLGDLVMKPGLHGPSPLSFDMDAPLPPRTPLINTWTNLLRLLWENDPALPDAVGPSSAASSPAQPYPALYNGRSRLIKTLDPTKFLEKGQASIDISCQADLRIVHSNGANKAMLPSYGGGKRQRYPDHAVGFPYFQPAEANRPRISSSIRFRLASTAEGFATGRDLELPDGTVWQVPILALAKCATSRALFEKLVEEGLIPHDLCRSLVASDSERNPKSAAVLYTLSDPFILDLSTCDHSLWAITEEKNLLASLATSTRLKDRSYEGVIRVRFEVSPLPQHAGRRIVVIHVLDVLEPIKPVHPSSSGLIPPPRAGGLLMGKSKFGTRLRSFDLDADRKKKVLLHDLLRLLWDSDAERRALPSL